MSEIVHRTMPDGTEKDVKKINLDVETPKGNPRRDGLSPQERAQKAARFGGLPYRMPLRPDADKSEERAAQAEAESLKSVAPSVLTSDEAYLLYLYDEASIEESKRRSAEELRLKEEHQRIDRERARIREIYGDSGVDTRNPHSY